MYRAWVYSRVRVTRALPPVGGTSFGPGGKRNIFIARPDAPITVDLAFGQASFIFGSRGNAACLSPSPTLISTGHDSYGENALIFTAPVPTLTSYGGANTKLTALVPALSVAATGTTLATASLAAPVGALASGGTVSGMANASLQAPVPNLIGYGGAVCSITLTGAPTLSATGTVGGVGSVAVTVPLAQLSATVTAQNHGSAILTAPAGKMAGTLQAYLVAPGATLTAIGSATITATYEAYALNLNHMPRRDGQEPIDELTHYTNFPFTHIVRYKNSYFGANSTGLYLLEGTTDDGAAIPWSVKTHLTDLGYPEKKTVVSAYFGGRLGPTETVALTVGEKGDETYAYTTPRGAAAQNYRQKFGRGVKTRYFGLGISGTQDFTLDTVDLEVDKLTRRI